jgi:hypothetical protein
MWGRCSTARTSEVRGWSGFELCHVQGGRCSAANIRKPVRQAPPPVNWTAIPNHRHSRFVVSSRRRAETVSRLIHDEVDC